MKHSSVESTKDIINICHEPEVMLTFEVNSGSLAEIQDQFCFLIFFSGRFQIEGTRVRRSVLCCITTADTRFPPTKKIYKKEKGG
jgi:hypothetical protein